jgi:hypothetical protein
LFDAKPNWFMFSTFWLDFTLRFFLLLCSHFDACFRTGPSIVSFFSCLEPSSWNVHSSSLQMSLLLAAKLLS